MDLDVSDAEISQYLTVDPNYSGPFNPRFVTDGTKVEISEEELELESAMGFGNGICRWRRQRRFERAIKKGDDRPVLVAEGDSWFQFPFLIDEVIDQLGDGYLIWSLGAAGDTAENMTGNNSEYMRGLDKWANHVRGFLFSAAGNDVIGEDLTGKPVLLKLLKPFTQGQSPAWHIERTAFSETLETLRAAYRKVIRNIRDDSRFERLPVFIHAYDYPYPYPFDGNDKRNPIHAASDEWLGKPFAELGYPSGAFRRSILVIMINELYAMMHDIAGEDTAGRVFVIDARGSLPNVDSWVDEIHGTSDGFKEVAKRFRDSINLAIGLSA
ncbi:MAG: hypothetical protein GY933_02155 [Hyphomicrobiales bacterium]|nr:hypothetical protein [Hyphomicrobiales bacterium]